MIGSGLPTYYIIIASGLPTYYNSTPSFKLTCINLTHSCVGVGVGEAWWQRGLLLVPTGQASYCVFVSSCCFLCVIILIYVCIHRCQRVYRLCPQAYRSVSRLLSVTGSASSCCRLALVFSKDGRWIDND